MNNKGMTILEVSIAMIMSSILMFAIITGLTGQLKMLKKVQNAQVAATKLPPPISPGADKRIYVSNLNECVSLQTGNWFAKRTDTRVVGFYQSSDCTSNFLGTLNALSNPTYDDTVTNTFWNVSGDTNTLRVLVHIENLP